MSLSIADIIESEGLNTEEVIGVTSEDPPKKLKSKSFFKNDFNEFFTKKNKKDNSEITEETKEPEEAPSPQIDRLPTKTELKEHIEDNINKEDLEEKEFLRKQVQLLHLGQRTCFSCVKSQNLSGNPRAKLYYCKWSGIMVVRHQPSCGKYQYAKGRMKKYEEQ